MFYLGTSSVVKDGIETSAFLRISGAGSVASGLLAKHHVSNVKLSAAISHGPGRLCIFRDCKAFLGRSGLAQYKA